MKLSNFPGDMIEHYGLKDKVDKNGFSLSNVFAGCMDYLTPGKKLRDSLRNAWRNMGTIKTRPQGCGRMGRDQSVSA